MSGIGKAGFNLTTLLRLRGVQEKEATAELAAANSEVSRIGKRRADVWAQAAGTTTTETSVNSLAAVNLSRMAAQSMLSDLTAMHDIASGRLAEAASAYRAARTSTLSLEKLQDRQDAEARAEALRSEQNDIDEIASTQWRAANGDER